MNVKNYSKYLFITGILMCGCLSQGATLTAESTIVDLTACTSTLENASGYESPTLNELLGQVKNGEFTDLANRAEAVSALFDAGLDQGFTREVADYFNRFTPDEQLRLAETASPSPIQRRIVSGLEFRAHFRWVSDLLQSEDFSSEDSVFPELRDYIYKSIVSEKVASLDKGDDAGTLFTIPIINDLYVLTHHRLAQGLKLKREASFDREFILPLANTIVAIVAHMVTHPKNFTAEFKRQIFEMNALAAKDPNWSKAISFLKGYAPTVARFLSVKSEKELIAQEPDFKKHIDEEIHSRSFSFTRLANNPEPVKANISLLPLAFANAHPELKTVFPLLSRPRTHRITSPDHKPGVDSFMIGYQFRKVSGSVGVKISPEVTEVYVYGVPSGRPALNRLIHRIGTAHPDLPKILVRLATPGGEKSPARIALEPGPETLKFLEGFQAFLVDLSTM